MEIYFKDDKKENWKLYARSDKKGAFTKVCLSTGALDFWAASCEYTLNGKRIMPNFCVWLRKKASISWLFTEASRVEANQYMYCDCEQIITPWNVFNPFLSIVRQIRWLIHDTSLELISRWIAVTEKMVGSKLHVNMCLSDRGLLLLSAPAKRLVQQMRLYAWSCAISSAYYISFWRHAQSWFTDYWVSKAMQKKIF